MAQPDPRLQQGIQTLKSLGVPVTAENYFRWDTLSQVPNQSVDRSTFELSNDDFDRTFSRAVGHDKDTDPAGLARASKMWGLQQRFGKGTQTQATLKTNDAPSSMWQQDRMPVYGITAPIPMNTDGESSMLGDLSDLASRVVKPLQEQVVKPASDREGPWGVAASLLPQRRSVTEAEQKTLGAAAHESETSYLFRMANAPWATAGAILHTAGEEIAGTPEHPGLTGLQAEYLQNLADYLGNGKGVADFGGAVGHKIDEAAPNVGRTAAAVATGGGSELVRAGLNAAGVEVPKRAHLPNAEDVLFLTGLGADLASPETIAHGLESAIAKLGSSAERLSFKPALATKTLVGGAQTFDDLTWTTRRSFDGRMLQEVAEDPQTLVVHGDFGEAGKTPTQAQFDASKTGEVIQVSAKPGAGDNVVGVVWKRNDKMTPRPVAVVTKVEDANKLRKDLAPLLDSSAAAKSVDDQAIDLLASRGQAAAEMGAKIAELNVLQKKKMVEIAEQRALDVSGRTFRAEDKARRMVAQMSEADVAKEAATAVKEAYFAEIEAIPAKMRAAVRNNVENLSKTLDSEGSTGKALDVMAAQLKKGALKLRDDATVWFNDVERTMKEFDKIPHADQQVEEELKLISNAFVGEIDFVVEAAKKRVAADTTLQTTADRLAALQQQVVADLASEVEVPVKGTKIKFNNIRTSQLDQNLASTLFDMAASNAKDRAVKALNDLGARGKFDPVVRLAPFVPGASRQELQQIWQLSNVDKLDMGLTDVAREISRRTQTQYDNVLKKMLADPELVADLTAKRNAIDQIDRGTWAADVLAQSKEFRDKLAENLADTDVWQSFSDEVKLKKAHSVLSLILDSRDASTESRAIALKKVDDYLFLRSGKFLRSSILGGTFLPNFRNIVGNFMMNPLIVASTLGFKSAVGGLAHLPEGFKIASYLSPGGLGMLNPLARDLDLARAVATRPIMDEAGRVVRYEPITYRDVIDMVNRGDIGPSQAAHEITADVLEQLKAALPDYKVKYVETYLGFGPNLNVWNQLNNDLDQANRVGVFIDALRQGDSELVAARKAKESLFDYNRQSELERRYLAKTVFFYSFVANNLKNALRNASSPLGVARLRNLLSLTQQTAPASQEVQEDLSANTRIKLASPSGLDGNYELYSPSIPAVEAVKAWADLGRVAYFLARVPAAAAAQMVGLMPTGPKGVGDQTPLSLAAAREAALQNFSNYNVSPYLQAFVDVMSEGQVDLRNRRVNSNVGGPDMRIVDFYHSLPFVGPAFDKAFGLVPDSDYQFKGPKGPMSQANPTRANKMKFKSPNDRANFAIFQHLLVDTIAGQGRTMRDYGYLGDPRFTVPEKAAIFSGIASPSRPNEDPFFLYLRRFEDSRKLMGEPEE